MTTHDLKTWPEPFAALVSGKKTFEIRLNDRGYAVGDVLDLDEYDPELKRSTGRRHVVEVTHMLSDYEFGVRPGFVVMSVRPAAVVELPSDPFAAPSKPVGRMPNVVRSSGPSRAFAAQYDGLCPDCGDEIEVGDMIAMTDDGAVHAECAS